MGKGRDKQKKKDRNDPDKQAKKAEKQMAKQTKHAERAEKKATAAAGGEKDEEDIEKLVSKLRTHVTGTISVAEVLQVPSERVSATLCPHPSRDTTHLLLFGGEFWNGVKTTTYNDLFCFSIPKKEWRLLMIHGAMPQPRSSHQSIVYKSAVIVFGGEFTAPSQNQFHHFKDTWRLECRDSSYVWEELSFVKHAPPPRSGHRMVLWRKVAVMFGGFFDTTAELRYYDDVWVANNLDTALFSWQEVEVKGAERPPPRSGHCMAVHLDTLLVYGGYSTEREASTGKATSKSHNDLWEMQLLTGTWTQIKKAGIPPALRSGMCMVHRAGGKAYVFGGVFDGEEGEKMRSKYFNDLFMLNLDTKRFFPMTLRKKKFAAKSNKRDGDTVDADLLANASTLGDSDDDEIVDDDLRPVPTGGPVVPDEARFTHVEIAPGVNVPCPRFNTMMCMAGPTLYLYGGQVEEGTREITFSDMYSLNLNRMDTYDILMQMDITKQPWYDPDGDWETQRSTATTAVTGLAKTEDDSGEDSRSDLSSSSSDDDDEEVCPALVPHLTAEALSAGQRQPRPKATASRLEELVSQLDADGDLPTPRDGENARTFFQRTRSAWEAVVQEHNAETGSTMKCDGFVFARRRFDEVMPVLDQIAYLRAEEEDRRRKEEKKKLAV